MKVTFQGKEVQNPVLRFAIVALTLIVAIPVAIFMILIFPVAYVLHAIGCPGIIINGKGRKIGAFSLNYTTEK